MDSRQLKRQLDKQSVVAKDPEDMHKRSPKEIMRQWYWRKIGGLIYSVSALGGTFYTLNWFNHQTEWNRTVPVPWDVSVAIGVVVFAVFGWWFYGLSAYRCPQCDHFVAMDLSGGFGALIQGSRPSREPEYCRNCRAALSP